MASEDEATDVGDGEEIPLNDLLTPEARNGQSGMHMQERSVIRIRIRIHIGDPGEQICEHLLKMRTYVIILNKLCSTALSQQFQYLFIIFHHLAAFLNAEIDSENHSL